jgi:hypothetical protein
MADTTALFDQALALSPEEREELALQILLSVEEDRKPPMSQQEFEAMIAERIEQHQRGEAKTVDAFEAIEEIRQRLRRRSE